MRAPNPNFTCGLPYGRSPPLWQSERDSGRAGGGRTGGGRASIGTLGAKERKKESCGSSVPACLKA